MTERAIYNGVNMSGEISDRSEIIVNDIKMQRAILTLKNGKRFHVRRDARVTIWTVRGSEETEQAPDSDL